MFPVQITKRKEVFVCQELEEVEEPQQGTPEIMVSPAFCSSFISITFLVPCTHFHSRHTWDCDTEGCSNDCQLTDSLWCIYTYICISAYTHQFKPFFREQLAFKILNLNCTESGFLPPFPAFLLFYCQFWCNICSHEHNFSLCWLYAKIVMTFKQ